MADIFEKAKELGIMIVESEEYKTLKATEEAQLDDKEAVELMMEYHTTRQTLNEKAVNPEITKEDFEALKVAAQAAFDKIMKNDKIAAYVAAQQGFSNMMDQINNILSYYVSGKDNEGGCTGSCSSCGGSCGHNH